MKLPMMYSLAGIYCSVIPPFGIPTATSPSKQLTRGCRTFDHVLGRRKLGLRLKGYLCKMGKRARRTPPVPCSTNFLIHPHNGMSDVDVTLHVVKAMRMKGVEPHDESTFEQLV